MKTIFKKTYLSIISYYCRVTYANGLEINPYRTNRPKYHEIRFT